MQVLFSCLFTELRHPFFSHTEQTFPIVSIILYLFLFCLVLGHTMLLSIFGGYVHWFFLSSFLGFTYYPFLLRYGSRVLTCRSVFLISLLLLCIKNIQFSSSVFHRKLWKGRSRHQYFTVIVLKPENEFCPHFLRPPYLSLTDSSTISSLQYKTRLNMAGEGLERLKVTSFMTTPFIGYSLIFPQFML